MQRYFPNIETKLMGSTILLLTAFLVVNALFSSLAPQAIGCKDQNIYLNDRYSLLVDSGDNIKPLSSKNNKELIPY